VTCLEVRERLTEYALGLLTKVDASEVERHLEWCAGCRKESGELEEGAARMALALPVVDPRTSLEMQVVDRVRSAAGRVPAGVRHRGGRLVAVALAAALLAVGATGWAIAERFRAQDLQSQIKSADVQLHNLAELVANFKVSSGKTTIAHLTPAIGSRGSGTAVIFSAPRVKDQIVISVLIPGGKGPYVVQLVDNRSAIKVGRLELGHRVEGDWFMWVEVNHDLSRVVTITVLDSESRTVLTGRVQPYVQ
jgi:putative zinc finger protein